MLDNVATLGTDSQRPGFVVCLIICLVIGLGFSFLSVFLPQSAASHGTSPREQPWARTQSPWNDMALIECLFS